MAGAVRRLTLPQWAAQPNIGNPLFHGQLRLLHTPFSTYVQGTPTKVNGPTITTDRLGQRTTFTAASSQYIDLGSPQSLTLGDELTFFAWYNLTSVPASGSSFTLIGKDHSSGGRSYTFDVLRNDVSPTQAGARLYVNGGAGGGIGIDLAYEGRQPVAGDDRFVVITRSVSRNVSAIYVDGVVGAVTTATASTPTATSTARIGSRQYTSFEGYMNGSVRLAGIINTALTTGEVMELFRDPAGQLFIPARQRIWTAPVTAGGGSLDLTETTGVALSGSVSVGGDIQIGTDFNLTQSSAVGLTGSLATTGDVQIGTTFDLAQSVAVGLAGSVGVSGDIQILSGSLDLTQTSAVAMSGTVGLSGDIQVGTSFDLAQTAAVGLTGSVSTSGNIQIGTDFNLTQSVVLAMSGSVAVTGDFQSGAAPVVTQAYGNFGWDPRIRPSWKRKELREELEAALDDAPKAVKELVRVPGPDISEAPVREALEVVRTARKHRERAVTRQEIDDLHEALETVATFTREREATRQARRRKQQHLLLLS